MNEDNFYIGYMPKAPKQLRPVLKLIILTIIIGLIAVVYMVASNQQAFDKTRFDYGEFTTLNGVVTMEPVPRIIINKGEDLAGKNISQSILLVNFGKRGVKPIFEQLQKELDNPLEAYEFQLRGTLIYGEGKTVFELTEEAAGVISYEANPKVRISEIRKSLGEVSLQGEVLDSKCYFGVMKPGYGKAHRSCAIRCISGGVTPVFLAKDAAGIKRYVLLVNKQRPIAPLKSDRIGKIINVSGNLSQLGNWLMLEVNDDLYTDIAEYAPSNAGNLLLSSTDLKLAELSLAGDITSCQ